MSALSFFVLVLLKIWKKRNSAAGNDGARKNEKTSISFKLVSIALIFSDGSPNVPFPTTLVIKFVCKSFLRIRLLSLS